MEERELNDADSWATFGVVARVSEPRTAANGGQFVVWKLSDLDGTEVSLFLFRTAFEAWYKEGPGAVVCVGNARALPRREDDEGFALSVSVATQVIKVGVAADMGQCRATRADGSRCGVVINVAKTQFCDFHIEKEYKKMLNARPAVNQAG